VNTSSTVADTDLPQLNPQLDRAQLAQDFARSGRIHIPNILTDPAARRLFQALQRETPWGLIFNEGLRTREVGEVSVQEYERMLGAAITRAHSSFQYIYYFHRLLTDRKIHPAPEHYLSKLAGFLTSQAFLDFIRQVTGQQAIAWTSSTATLYRPLNFLTIHDDNDTERPQGGKRLVAYVLNMTPRWNPDWGGSLQFFDRRDHIEESYLPAFNALNLFLVPKFHSVGQVAAFGGERYGISGWFEADAPLPPSRLEI